MYVVKSPPRNSWPAPHGIAALLLAAALLAVGAGFAPHTDITVDGVAVAVPARSTLGSLRRAGIIDAAPGRLLAVDGTVLKIAGGQTPQMHRNGTLVAETQRVFGGDVIVTTGGVDRVEPSGLLREPIQFETRIEGKGPVMMLAQPGSVGVRQVTRGRVSGVRTEGRIILPASDMVVKRTVPRPSEKLVALTFDDGPRAGQTDKILDILHREGIHATFFMLGGSVKNAPSLAKRVADEGHLLGTHTLGHKLLTREVPAEVNHQITAGVGAVRSATGRQPVWFRPPYGAIDADVWKQTRALRLKVALWDIDTEDWKRPGADSIISSVEGNARAGSIILMHDGGPDRTQTVAALPVIIRNLKARGFVFVTLEELDAAR